MITVPLIAISPVKEAGSVNDAAVADQNVEVLRECWDEAAQNQR